MSAPHASTARWFRRDSPVRLKVAALVVAAPVVALLLLLAFGEVAGGDVSGLQHLVEVLPLLLLLGAAWRWPRAGGLALVAAGLLIAAVYALFAWDAEVDPLGILVAAALLLAPPVIAGLLFLAADRAGRRRAAGQS